jgi:hypothetical protein
MELNIRQTINRMIQNGEMDRVLRGYIDDRSNTAYPSTNIFMLENTRRRLNTINDLVYYYNQVMLNYQSQSNASYHENITLYQRNVSQLINALNDRSTEVREPTNSFVSAEPVNRPTTAASNPRPTPRPQPTSAASNPRPTPRPQPNSRQNSFARSNRLGENAEILFSYIFEPIINRTNRGLTSEQIENATELVTYALDMGENRCAISWEDFTVGESVCRIRHCGHIFKRAGLINWFGQNVNCPTCRYDLRNYRANAQADASRNTINNTINSPNTSSPNTSSPNTSSPNTSSPNTSNPINPYYRISNSSNSSPLLSTNDYNAFSDMVGTIFNQINDLSNNEFVFEFPVFNRRTQQTDTSDNEIIIDPID